MLLNCLLQWSPWLFCGTGVLDSWGPALPKYSRHQMVMAAADLLALSRCAMVLGTHHSTFSYVAQALGSHPQVETRP